MRPCALELDAKLLTRELVYAPRHHGPPAAPCSNPSAPRIRAASRSFFDLDVDRVADRHPMRSLSSGERDRRPLEPGDLADQRAIAAIGAAELAAEDVLSFGLLRARALVDVEADRQLLSLSCAAGSGRRRTTERSSTAVPSSSPESTWKANMTPDKFVGRATKGRCRAGQAPLQVQFEQVLLSAQLIAPPRSGPGLLHLRADSVNPAQPEGARTSTNRRTCRRTGTQVARRRPRASSGVELVAGAHRRKSAQLQEDCRLDQS